MCDTTVLLTFTSNRLGNDGQHGGTHVVFWMGNMILPHISVGSDHHERRERMKRRWCILVLSQDVTHSYIDKQTNTYTNSIYIRPLKICGHMSMVWCMKDRTALLTHWSYAFIAATHRCTVYLWAVLPPVRYNATPLRYKCVPRDNLMFYSCNSDPTFKFSKPRNLFKFLAKLDGAAWGLKHLIW